MSKDAFEQRGQSLEEAFFKERDAQLLAKLRSELSSLEDKKKLSHVSGIVDDKVLSDLVKLGVSAESLLAMGLVPMITIAWADGSVAPDERTAILQAAAEDGIAAGSSAYELLNQWLLTRPDERFASAWKEYVTGLCSQLPSDNIGQLKQRVLDRCDRVAKSSGGVLGFGKVSTSEQTAMNKIASVFAVSKASNS